MFALAGLLLTVAVVRADTRTGSSAPPRQTLPIGEGTHIFRRVLHDAGLQPLKEWAQLLEEPQKKILIVLGEIKTVLPRLPARSGYRFGGDGLPQFVGQGGAVLIATDRNWDAPFFGVSVLEQTVRVKAESPSAYVGSPDCVFVQAREAGRPLFRRPMGNELLERVATNRPGHLRANVWSRLPVLAEFPPDTEIQIAPFRLYTPQKLYFAAGGTWGRGRLLVLADHSVFINAMLWQSGQADPNLANDNLDFTYNCVDWLTENKRTHVLFVEEGQVRTSFDIPLKQLPPPPLPPVDQLVQIVNQGLRGMEDEDHFNTLLANAFRDINADKLLAGLLICMTLGLALYGLSRLSQARHRLETGVPLLANELAGTGGAVPVLDQRHQTLLRNGNFWETARALARQGFETTLGPPLWAKDGPARGPEAKLPPLHVQGNWRRRWMLRRRVARLWRLAYRDTPVWITARQLRRLEAQVDEVQSALADGRLAIGAADTPEKA
jgi:hypothetical protein